MNKWPPLFVPLKREHFEAFESGKKTHEFRAAGPRWNERTCIVGREVVLSLGYGKARRLRGYVSSFTVQHVPEGFKALNECAGRVIERVACIGIKLDEVQS